MSLARCLERLNLLKFSHLANIAFASLFARLFGVF
jgi:hypothetical protein